MGAVCRENPELIARHPTYPARERLGGTVCRPAIGSLVGHQPGRALGEFCNRTKRNPLAGGFLDQGRTDEADNRDADHQRGDRVNPDTNLKQEIATSRVVLCFGAKRSLMGFVRAHGWFAFADCIVAALFVVVATFGAGPWRCETNQATTSDISSGDIGLPG